MIHIINTEELTENGINYIVEHYSNNGTIKYMKPDSQSDSNTWNADLIDENTVSQLEMQTNIQYLVDLAEINQEV